MPCARAGLKATYRHHSQASSQRDVRTGPVYEVRDGKYYLTSLALVTGGDYTLTGWYDKDQTDGGRIRVILAK